MHKYFIFEKWCIYFGARERALVTETVEKDDEKLQATTTSEVSEVFPSQFFIKK